MDRSHSVSRILIASGIIWSMYTLVAHTGSHYPGAGALFALLSLGVPFFVLGWTAGVWPRITGVLLLLCAAAFFRYFGLQEASGGEPLTQGRLLTILFFIGPLAGGGVILLTEGGRRARNRRS